MSVKDFLQQLSWTHLGNVAVGLSGAGAIDPAKVPMLVALVNEGLMQLHARWMLKEGNCIIEMLGHVTRYELSSRFAESSYDPLVVKTPYIKDSKEEPFLDDVLQVVEVTDQFGQNCPVNYAGHPLAVFVTAVPQVLQVPTPRDGVALAVRYRAAHARLHADDLDADIVLPPQLLPVLADYVAGKVLQGMNIEHAQAASQQYMAQFHGAVAALAGEDAFSLSQARVQDKFHANGWV